MPLTDQYTTHHGVRLHYLDSAPGGGVGVPILFVPGLFGTAEQCRVEIEALAPRRGLALSLRGRGHSDTPETGYTFADHVGDVEAVIAAAGLGRFALMGYSAGVPPAIEVAARHPDQVAGLLLGDYPARVRKHGDQWGENARQQYGDSVNEKLIAGLVRDSADIELWGRLGDIACPTLVMRGGQPGALLSPDEATRYLRHLRNALVAVFEEAGHDLAAPSPERYLNTLRAMLTQIDALEGA